MTDYSSLLSEGRIKRGRFSRKQVEDCLEIARRDLKTARTVTGTSPEWTFNISYNAMHQAGRALMFHHGYRTAGEGHHSSVVQFLGIALGPGNDEILDIMDRMRRKRNRATYDMVGTISRKEAEEAIEASSGFVADIIQRIQKATKAP